jgi:hypothetical protein
MGAVLVLGGLPHTDSPSTGSMPLSAQITEILTSERPDAGANRYRDPMLLEPHHYSSSSFESHCWYLPAKISPLRVDHKKQD